MTKKWLQRIIRIMLCILLLLVLADVVLHLVSRTEWFHTRVSTFLQQTLGREIKLANMGINLRGIFVEGLEVAEQGGFEKGTFVEVGLLRIRFSLLHLLHGHTKIHHIVLANVTAKAVIYPDGSTNWADLIPTDTAAASQEQTASKAPFDITADHIHLENLRLIYVDDTVPHAMHIDRLTVGASHFSWKDPFPFYVQAQINPTVRGTSLQVPVALQGTLDLNNLDLSQAKAHIQALTTSYNKASVTLQGDVENFENPQANFRLTLRNISADQFNSLATLPPFDLKEANASIKLAANLDKQALTLHHFSFQAPGLEGTAHGGLLYGNPQQIEYDFSTDINLVLGEMGRWLTVLAEPYRLIGTIHTDWHTTHKQIAGKITLQGIGGEIPQAGNLSDVNATLTAEEAMDFQTGNVEAEIAGKLNGRPFVASVTEKQTTEKIDIHLKAHADELMFRLSEDIPTSASLEQAPAETVSKPWSLAPMHIRADIKLGQVDVPYFYGKDVSFTANVQQVTPDLKQAQGTLRLTTGEGKIQDIYKLTDASPLTKVLFLSLNITGKVFNSLNVFGVLESIGSGISSAVAGEGKKETAVKTQTILGPDGEPLEIAVVETDKKISGEMEYDKFDTEVNFVRGLATIKEGTFVSPMMSFRLDGTTDFNTQEVNMTVHAAPGQHEVDGMMPLTLKISGTVDNPQGNMQVLNSVASLVTQSVTNNVVSRQIGKGIKGFLGLFKKKDKSAASEPFPQAEQVSGNESILPGAR